MATRSSNISLVNTLTIQQRPAFLAYAKQCASKHSSTLADFRTLLRYRDRAYQRQLNITAEHIKAVRANMAGDSRKIQDITVPIVMPQIESAVAYQTGVYLTSSPIFGVVAPKDQMDAAMAFETAMNDHAIKYGWTRELIKVFRNAFKYNFAPAVALWHKTPLKRVVTDTSISQTGLAKLEGYSYGGNCITAVSPYNCFMDMTVDPANMHTDGEFFGWNDIISRVQLKRLLASLDTNKTTSATDAFNSQFTGSSQDTGNGMTFHHPVINQYLNMGNSSHSSRDWAQWMGLAGARKSGINYKDNYVITRFLCRAMPSDFGGTGNTARVYYGIIINWQTVIYVEEMNNAHDMLPAFIMQGQEDGLGYQTQSMLDNALPFQDMSSSLWNISLESKRRLVFDRLIYNPRMIDKKDIDPASSVARIALRNVAMGKDDNAIARAIYQIPYREDNSSSNIQMSDMISSMADSAAGQNRVDRGQFQKGNKTKTEFESTMSNSNSRQQLVSLGIEHQFMTPLKEVLKSNMLQYQPAAKFLDREKQSMVDVDPVALRKSILEFKITDGLIPADKMMNAELLTVFLQTAQALPAVATEYDIMGMFLYWAKLKGAYWINDFKRNPQQQQEFLSTLQQTTAASEPPMPPAPGQGAPV